jgi:hypothetical protein
VDPERELATALRKVSRRAEVARRKRDVLMKIRSLGNCGPRKKLADSPVVVTVTRDTILSTLQCTYKQLTQAMSTFTTVDTTIYYKNIQIQIIRLFILKS